jgi:hypothetical protein
MVEVVSPNVHKQAEHVGFTAKALKRGMHGTSVPNPYAAGRVWNEKYIKL